MKGEKGIVVAALVLAIAGFSRIASAQGEDLPIIRLAEPLSIEMTGPPADAVAVAPDSTIVVQFSHPLDCITVSSAGIWLSEKAAPQEHLSGSLRCDDGTITLTPDAPLMVDASYAVTVNTLIRGAKGERLDKDYAFSFSTMKDGLNVLPGPAEEWRATEPLP